jgi:hypothetical protein
LFFADFGHLQQVRVIRRTAWRSLNYSSLSILGGSKNTQQRPACLGLICRSLVPYFLRRSFAILHDPTQKKPTPVRLNVGVVVLLAIPAWGSLALAYEDGLELFSRFIHFFTL